MSDSTDATPGPPGGARPSAENDDLERLRRLIIAGDLDRLADIEQRLGDANVRAEEISHILPEALVRAAHRNDRLGVALSGVLDEALDVSIKKHRKRLADVLAPAMGPAIRRAIAEALRAVVDSFNQVLQHSFSSRALRWRVEAWRTGRPFAEVVLSHSLVFRVEQVFLVHRKTGLLLQHVAADHALVQDADLVSGMLTAIQDFVRDSFAVDAGQAVDTMRVGDLAVWVEQGEAAYVAAVIRGTPPTDLRGVLRDALETIHLDLGPAFETFTGDSAPFEDARHALEGCLQVQVQGKARKRPWLAPAIAAGVGALLLLTWTVLEIRAARRWDNYLARLAAEPGIVVVKEDHGIRRASISGLRDADAADPILLLPACTLDPSRVTSRWDPYVSTGASMVLVRARSWLNPPPSVAIEWADGVLSAAGSAPHQWVAEARRIAASMPGVRRFDTARLKDEGVTAVGVARERLGLLVLRFDPGSAELPPREQAAFDSAVAEVQEIAKVASAAGVRARVEVVGHTDDTGSERTNVRLSRARAEWVLAAIEARGVRGLDLALVGAATNEPLRAERNEEDRALNRSVTFRVIIEP